MQARLTPTSYTLLALLDITPFSAYELTQYMQRSALRELWPRAEASIYREPKKLVAHGLARSRQERHGQRSRTVFEITPSGRRALRDWLAEPGGGLRFECEAAVKAFFGDAAGLDELRANLEFLCEEHETTRREGEELFERWLDGELRFPHRLQYTALSATLIARIRQAVAEWAEAWLEYIDEWETTELHPVSEEQARDAITELAESAPQLSPEVSGLDEA